MKRIGNKRLRQLMRTLHTVVGISLILYIYTPLQASSVYSFYIGVIAIPLVSLSGLALWQQPRLSKAVGKWLTA